MLVLFAVVAAARADDITLTDGRAFKDAKVLSQTPTHVTIRHAAGMNQISKAVLPDDLRAKYPIDQEAADKSRGKDAAAREENQRRVAALQEAQKIKAANFVADTPAEIPVAERVRELAEMEIKRYFKRPESAEFRHSKIFQPLQGWDYYEVVGTSGATNGLGTMVWGSHRVIVKYHGVGDRLELIYLEMAGTPKEGSWENKSAPPANRRS